MLKKVLLGVIALMSISNAKMLYCGNNVRINLNNNTATSIKDNRTIKCYRKDNGKYLLCPIKNINRNGVVGTPNILIHNNDTMMLVIDFKLPKNKKYLKKKLENYAEQQMLICNNSLAKLTNADVACIDPILEIKCR